MSVTMAAYATNSQAVCDPLARLVTERDDFTRLYFKMATEDWAASLEMFSVEKMYIEMLQQSLLAASNGWIIPARPRTARRRSLVEKDPAVRQAKNAAALSLLERWLSDTSDYDYEAWPVVKKVIEENSTSVRRPFNE